MKSRYGLEIRAATGADAPGLSEFLTAMGHPVPARDLAARLDRLRTEPGAVLIAVEWGPPSGLVVVHWYGSVEVAEPRAQITTLAVGPEDRRRGLGRMLLKAAAQAARVAGCGSLELLVGEGREDLRAFCAATGFEPVGARFERPLRKRTG